MLSAVAGHASTSQRLFGVEFATRAWRTFLLALVLNLAGGLGSFLVGPLVDEREAPPPGPAVFVVALAVGVTAVLFVSARRGRAWPRWVLLVLCVGAVAFSFVELPPRPWAVLDVVALGLLVWGWPRRRSAAA